MAIFPRKQKPAILTVAVPDYSAAESLTPPDAASKAGSKSYTISKTGWYVWVPNVNAAFQNWGVWWSVNDILVAGARVGNDGGHTDSKIFPVSVGDVVKVYWTSRNKGVARGNCKMYLIPVKYITI